MICPPTAAGTPQQVPKTVPTQKMTTYILTENVVYTCCKNVFVEEDPRPGTSKPLLQEAARLLHETSTGRPTSRFHAATPRRRRCCWPLTMVPRHTAAPAVATDDGGRGQRANGGAAVPRRLLLTAPPPPPSPLTRSLLPPSNPSAGGSGPP